VTADQLQTFDPFSQELAYIRVNERMMDRVFKLLGVHSKVDMLDIGANSGLQTNLAFERARARGIEIKSNLIDLDEMALKIARQEVHGGEASYTHADAARLPFKKSFDLVVFANALHLLPDAAKRLALEEARRVLKPGGLFATNSTFYEGAYPEESKPFYSRWIRRAVAEVNRRVPNRSRGEKAQAMESLTAAEYRDLIECAGFRIVEMRERRVLLSQAAVRAICAYKTFAMGALHATDEDAEEAAKSLQVTVKSTFNELKMKYLPRNWLEIIAVPA
jgi:ubiquinone/menaquinone biosynthesis C-methylase UbiE